MSGCGATDKIVSFFLGVTLSGNTGLRATVPLFLLSVISQTHDCVQLASGMEWIGSVWFAVIFGLLMVVEVVADKIPGVVHVLHAAMTIIHPLCGAVVAIAPLVTDSWGVRIPILILGGLIALVLHIGRMLVRFLVSGATAGFCNPCVSLIEDVIVFIVCPLSILLGVAALIFGAVILVVFVGTSIIKGYRKCTGNDPEDETFISTIVQEQTEPRPWVDDSLQKKCKTCGKDFGVVKRKHHCRWCGNIFCGSCSSKQCEVPTLKGDQRVCNRCYDVLTTPKPAELSAYVFDSTRLMPANDEEKQRLTATKNDDIV